MSKPPYSPMSFREFSKQFNANPALRVEYRKDPVAVIERDLKIMTLTDAQKADLKEKVQQVAAKVPDFKLCVAGEPFVQDPDVMVQ